MCVANLFFSFSFRYVDIRICKRGDRPTNLTIHHGISYQNARLDEVLKDIDAFLDTNPSECILMQLQSTRADDCNKVAADPVNPEDYKTIVLRYLDALSEGRLLKTSSIPNLQDCRGKLVILNRVTEDGYFVNLGYDGILYREESELLVIQGKYNVPSFGDKPKFWNLVRKHLNWAKNNASVARSVFTADDMLYLNFASGVSADTFGLPNTPKVVANYMNPRILAHLRKENKRTRWGAVILDFPTRALVGAIFKSNFDNVPSLPGKTYKDYCQCHGCDGSDGDELKRGKLLYTITVFITLVIDKNYQGDKHCNLMIAMDSDGIFQC